MNNKLKMGILTALCLFALSCGNGNGQSGKVLFESSDKKIKVYESEVQNEMQKSLDAQGLKANEVTPEQLTQLKQDTIKNIALNRAVALDGKEKKIDKEKKYTDSIEYAKEGLLANLTLTAEANKISVTDDEAKQAYEANKASFDKKEDTVKLQLVIVSATDKAKAEAALKEATANPANFSAVVQKYSANAAKTGNGETPEITASQLSQSYAPISQAIANVQPGQVVNNVVTVGNELYIIKVLEKNPKGLMPFEKVKDLIKNQIRTQKRQLETQKYLQNITSKYGLSKLDETLKTIK